MAQWTLSQWEKIAEDNFDWLSQSQQSALAICFRLVVKLKVVPLTVDMITNLPPPIFSLCNNFNLIVWLLGALFLTTCNNFPLSWDFILTRWQMSRCTTSTSGSTGSSSSSSPASSSPSSLHSLSRRLLRFHKLQCHHGRKNLECGLLTKRPIFHHVCLTGYFQSCPNSCSVDMKKALRPSVLGVLEEEWFCNIHAL